jgi:6-phosphogluconolactonase (cycloisomerase 2 family)
MKRILIFVTLLFFISCENGDTEKKSDVFQNNIAFICNQGSGYLTVIDMISKSIIKEINLKEKMQVYYNALADTSKFDEVFVNQPRPHYVQTSFDGKYLYVMFTFRKGGIAKLDIDYNVINFKVLEETEFPAHMQLTSDDSDIYISTWTTNTMMNSSGVSGANNMMIKLSSDFKTRFNYTTPAGAHGIKLMPNEDKIVIGHDLSDFINIIPLNALDNPSPLNTAKALTANADINGGDATAIYSPTQLGISPDGKYALFSCKKASKILVYSFTDNDTLGFLDLKSLYGVDNAGPYSIEIGPKTGFNSSESKYAYINFKNAGYFARLKMDYSKTGFQNIFTADSTKDLIKLKNSDARPHGLDITDDASQAIVSSEFLNSNGDKAHTFIINLDTFTITKEFETKVQSRGVCIYPSSGN